MRYNEDLDDLFGGLSAPRSRVNLEKPPPPAIKPPPSPPPIPPPAPPFEQPWRQQPAAPVSEARPRGSCGLIIAAMVLAAGMAAAAFILKQPAPPALPPETSAPVTDTASKSDSPAAPAETKESALTLRIADNAAMSFAPIPAGRFMMGSPETEAGRGADEFRREVTISRPFYLGERSVTQSQYESVMGVNPSLFKGSNRPVENVSWDDATEFCRRVSEFSGRSMRLPTEAEWEYACRAGTTTAFHTGAAIRPEQAHFNSRTGTVDAGSFPANAWSLFDMHGNAQEWCADWHGPYETGPVADPKGPPKGESRVLRGGGWRHPPENLRSAHRGKSPPESRARDIGFRVLLEKADLSN